MSIKAKFLEQQQPVKFTVSHGKIYVFICLHEKEVIDFDLEGNKSVSYEYDYNEFFDDIENVNRKDIRENPEAYLMYDPNKEVNLYHEVEALKEENGVLHEMIMNLEIENRETSEILLELLDNIYE